MKQSKWAGDNTIPSGVLTRPDPRIGGLLHIFSFCKTSKKLLTHSCFQLLRKWKIAAPQTFFFPSVSDSIEPHNCYNCETVPSFTWNFQMKKFTENKIYLWLEHGMLDTNHLISRDTLRGRYISVRCGKSFGPIHIPGTAAPNMVEVSTFSGFSVPFFSGGAASRTPCKSSLVASVL